MVTAFVAALLLADAEIHYYRGVARYADVVQGKAATAEEKRRHLDEALAAFDCALAFDAGHFSAIVYRSLTLRQQAFFAAEAKKKQALTAAADAARSRAIELVKQGKRRKVTPDPTSIR
jgi:serine protease inhibitor